MVSYGVFAQRPPASHRGPLSFVPMKVFQSIDGPVFLDDGDPTIPGSARIRDIATFLHCKPKRLLDFARRLGVEDPKPTTYLDAKQTRIVVTAWLAEKGKAELEARAHRSSLRGRRSQDPPA